MSAVYDGVIPESGDEPGPYSPNDSEDAEFFGDINSLLKEYVDAMEYAKLRLGLQTVMAVSARGNLYLQVRSSPSDPDSLELIRSHIVLRPEQGAPLR